MSENLRKKLVFAGFIAAVAWGYWNFHDPKSAPVATDVVVAEGEHTANISVGNPSRPINIEAKAKEPWGADPFHPEFTPSSKSAQPARSLYWQLSGIIYTSQSQLAIINGKPVKVGQTVDNATVIMINKNEVVLEANGVRMTLTVTQG